MKYDFLQCQHENLLLEIWHSAHSLTMSICGFVDKTRLKITNDDLGYVDFIGCRYILLENEE